MQQEVIQGIASTLVYDPPERARPGASPTVTLYTPSGAVLAASGAATRDTVATTLASAVAVGDQSLTLTSVTGVAAGRSYLLSTSGSGLSEMVRVRSVTGSVATLAEGVTFAHAVGSAFEGLRLTRLLTTTETATLGDDYRAEWSYTVASQPRRTSTMWGVVRTPWPDEILSLAEFRRYGGDLALQVLATSGVSGDGFEEQIRNAEESLRADLLERNAKPSSFKSFDAFKPVVAQGVLLWFARIGQNIPSAYQGQANEWLQLRESEYRRELDRALAATRSYDADGDGTPEPANKPARVRFWL